MIKRKLPIKKTRCADKTKEMFVILADQFDNCCKIGDKKPGICLKVVRVEVRKL